jgi:hypothetical protein
MDFDDEEKAALLTAVHLAEGMWVEAAEDLAKHNEPEEAAIAKATGAALQRAKKKLEQ